MQPQPKYLSPVEPPSQSQPDSRFTMIEGRLKTLESNVLDLEKRLVPVLRLVPGSQCATVADQEDSSPFAQQLGSIVRGLDSANQCLSNLLSKLDLP